MTRWILYDDPASKALRPFTWLRPASSLLIGAETNLERWRRLAGRDNVQVACRGSLVPLEAGRWDLDIARRGISAANGTAAASNSEIWVSDLLLGDATVKAVLESLEEDEIALCQGEPAGFRVGPRVRSSLSAGDDRGTFAQALEEIGGSRLPTREVAGSRLQGLADLIELQERMLERDLERLLLDSPAPFQSGDAFTYRPQDIRLADGCRIDHGAVLDAREGPVVMMAGCEVAPHTWVKGPFFAGAGCSLLGGRIGSGTSLGPRSKVRGEVEASIFLGLSNKAHDGFVGHSYLGEWVNLGALTTTSDLKNNYSCVTLEPEGRKVETRLRKVGVFLGDHVKTRIGSLINSGTIVGVGSNLIGEPAVAGKWVADFGWGTGSAAVEYDINKFLQTAEIVYGRRGIAWTPEVVSVLREIHVATETARRSQIGGK